MAEDWKVILGTSNVKRNYDPKNFEFEAYKVKKCCRMETFKAEAAMLTAENQYIIVSVFENILVDKVNESIALNHTVDVNEVTVIDNEKVHADVLGTTIEVTEVIKQIGIRCPDSMITVTAPLLRPASEWYTQHHGLLEHNCRAGVQSLSVINPRIRYLDTI